MAKGIITGLARTAAQRVYDQCTRYEASRDFRLGILDKELGFEASKMKRYSILVHGVKADTAPY
jgi:hypothetical protein